MEMQEVFEMANHALSKHGSTLSSLYGEELGVAKLVRDGRSFRIFSKKIEETKSGKAYLVELEVFVDVDDKPFAIVNGVTYLPKFVLDNKDVYWILENKISGKLQEDPHYITIKGEYIPRKYTAMMYKHSYGNKKTPEMRYLSFMKDMYQMRNRAEGEMKLEVAMESWV